MKRDDDGFFIGWAPEPPRDRRFFLRAGIVLTAATAGVAGVLAAAQGRPGPGRWDPDDVSEWRGIVTASPYPLLRTRGVDGRPQTLLLSCLGKCGVADRLGALAGRTVIVRGSLIERGAHAMLSVDEAGDWIRAVDASTDDAALAFGARQRVGEVRLDGEVLDSKCWFGAMRPSRGKVHRACASLCIRGGIPPAFFADGEPSTSALMILADGEQPHGRELLPLVAEPVRIAGTLFRQDDLLILDAPVARIARR